jgi:hypothetical protein
MIKIFLVQHAVCPLGWYFAIQAVKKSVGAKEGWTRFYNPGESFDVLRHPIPCLTYPVANILDRAKANGLMVCKWVSGQLDLYFCGSIMCLVACEHGRGFLQRIVGILMFYSQPYCNGLEDVRVYLNFKESLGFIHGCRGVECAKQAIYQLADRGVIAWKITDRTEYDEIKFFQESKFLTIDFRGQVHSVPGKSCSSVFFGQATA